MSEKQGAGKGIASQTERMRADWNRRVEHDYRYWMSDGVESDEAMWNVGKRDFEILTKNLSPADMRGQVALELGCGVGRILLFAAEAFREVIGVDVSESAIEQAKRLVGPKDNVSYQLVDGFSLDDIADESVDFVYSFAAISSMPVLATASYLVELSRIVKTGGLLRLQLYLGFEQQTFCEDTIAIRSYAKERFAAAVYEAGFDYEETEELILPFEVSDPEAGLEASIVSLRRRELSRLDSKALAAMLVEELEPAASESWRGSTTEYLMAITRAHQHLEKGQLKEARDALEFAVSNYGEPEPQVVTLLEEIRAEVEQVTKNTQAVISREVQSQHQEAVVQEARSLGAEFSSEHYEQNLLVLKDRAPELANKVEISEIDSKIKIISGGSGSKVINIRGIDLDHPEKPLESAQSWAKRTLNTKSLQEASAIIVTGFLGGFHLRALLDLTDKEVHCFEPNPALLKAALALEDQRDVLVRLASIGFSPKHFESLLGKQETVELVIHPKASALSRDSIDQLKSLFWSERGLRELRPSIAVMGPIYGGSLPIARYTTNALQLLGQRSVGYDFSAFYEGYTHMEGIVRDKARSTVLQNNYVEMLSQVVLEAINERPTDILICLAQAPLSPRVLTELRNRGIILVMWFVEDCRRFQAWKEIARYYDYMFLIQEEVFPGLVEQAGAGSAKYLPVACEPRIHCPLELSDEDKGRWGSALSHVGAGYNNRKQVFASLVNYDFKIWGTEWPDTFPFNKLVQEKGRRLSPEEYVRVFNASDVNINLHSSAERDGVDPKGDFVNPRTFELAASGAFQLVDRRTLLPPMFKYDEELGVFSDRRELEEKIDFYLANPEERSKVSERARLRALSEHTYEQRIRSMLGMIYADRYEQLKTRLSESPWERTLRASEEFPELHDRFDTVYARGGEPKLEELVVDIVDSKGALSETEQKLLFLHHVKSQISYVNNLRSGKSK